MRMRRNSQGYFEIVNTANFEDTSDLAFYIEQVGNHPIFLRTNGNDQITIQSTDVTIGVGGGQSAKFDGNVTPNETRFLLWDITAGVLKRVKRGAADSGGPGSRMLIIDN
jgi:hypothetical protein